jgi:hypothetical protein
VTAVAPDGSWFTIATLSGSLTVQQKTGSLM